MDQLSTTKIQCTVYHPINTLTPAWSVILFLASILVITPVFSAQTYTFQQGVNGYSGTSDTTIVPDTVTVEVSGEQHTFSPDTAAGDAPYLLAGTEYQTLIQFADIFGNGAGQIPEGSYILNATLTFTLQSHAITILKSYRMLTPWGDSLTYSDTAGGIPLDGISASESPDSASTNLGPLEVTASLNAWAVGATNYGWVIHGVSDSSAPMFSSESQYPPILTVTIADPPVSLVTDIGIVPPDFSPIPDSPVISKRPITIDFSILETGPESLQINLPDNKSFVIYRDRFIPRAGYATNDQKDALDCTYLGCDLIPDPTVTPDEMSYRWFGSNRNYEVGLSVHRGLLRGILEGESGRWLISRDSDGVYQLYELDRTKAPEPDPIIFAPAEGTAPAAPKQSLSVVQLDTKDWYPNKTLSNKNIDSKAVIKFADNEIDILVLYTEQARIEAGGNPSDPNDIADIDIIIRAAVDDLQSAFDVSQMDTVAVGKLNIAKLSGFTPSGQPDFDLAFIQNDLNVESFRSQYGADIVSLVVRNYNDLGYAGVAYTQRPGCTFPTSLPGCDIGPAFSEFAFSIVAYDAAHTWYSFAHEVGHNLGGEHDWDTIQSQTNNTFTRANASFPYAFGHYTSGQYKSLMAYPHGLDVPSWTLQISDPGITYNGWVTGITDEAHNAAAMTHWAIFVSSFRERVGDVTCSGQDVVLTNRTFVLGEYVTCIGTSSIQTNSITVESGAQLELISPTIQLLPVTSIQSGGEFRAVSE